MARVKSTRLEASRTNNLTRSEELGHADWTASNCTVTADADTAPDGATTADNLSDTASGAHGFVSQAVTVADDSLDDAASAYFEKKSSDHIAMLGLEFTGGTTTLTYEVEVNLNGGATDVTNSADAPTRVTVEEGWKDYYRVSVVGANNGTGNTSATVKAYPHVGTTLGTRDTSAQGDADAWGAQLEDGAFPSSYVATTTAAVTRSADSLSFDISGTPLATPQEMTVYGKLHWRLVPDGTFYDVTSIGGDSISNIGQRLSISRWNDDKLLVENRNAANLGVNVAIPAGSMPAFGDILEYVATLHADGSVEVSISVNGGALVSDGPSAAQALDANWRQDSVFIQPPNFTGFNDHLALTISPGVKTMDEMRSLAGVR